MQRTESLEAVEHAQRSTQTFLLWQEKIGLTMATSNDSWVRPKRTTRMRRTMTTIKVRTWMTKKMKKRTTTPTTMTTTSVTTPMTTKGKREQNGEGVFMRKNSVRLSTKVNADNTPPVFFSIFWKGDTKTPVLLFLMHTLTPCPPNTVIGLLPVE